jgi:hypothetical protein
MPNQMPVDTPTPQGLSRHHSTMQPPIACAEITAPDIKLHTSRISEILLAT